MLNPKQTRFCREYVIDLNGKQAAIRAGYSEKTAEVHASRLLRNVKVQEFIQELSNEKTKQIDITVEWVLTGIKSIGDDKTATKTERLKAYELGGKYNKIFADKSEIHMADYDMSILPVEFLERIKNGELIEKVFAEYFIQQKKA